MSELLSENASLIQAACKAGAEEAAGALGRALGGEFTWSVGTAAAFDIATPPADFDGPGLVISLQVGEKGLALALPSASGLVPEWCAAPDVSGESRLATLAQELSILLLPESLSAADFKAGVVDNLTAALVRARIAAGASVLTMETKQGKRSAQLSLIWPLEAPRELLLEPATTAPPQAAKPATKADAASPAAPGRDLSTLPNYSRSLLKIKVPVCVQLAGKKERVQEVISLAPGSIIKFDKGCEDLLQMIVGEHTIAEGEAVKIGEKFGFRVISMKMPPEHFVPAKKPRRA